MKTLPNGLNGLTVFNATPHAIRFWREEWNEPVEVGPDEIISAQPTEYPGRAPGGCRVDGVKFVRVGFAQTDEGMAVIQRASDAGADVIVGSIIAAQAYPGLVVGMTPAPGYERVPPAEKRMNPDKFVVF